MLDTELIHGDCLEEMDYLLTNSIDMIMVDVSYGVTHCKWDSIIPLKPMWKLLHRIVKSTGAVVFTSSQPFTTTLISSNRKFFRYCWVWNKITCPTGFLNCNRRPLRIVEDVVVFYQKQCVYNPHMTKGKKYTTTSGAPSSQYNSYTTGIYRESSQRYPKDLLHISRGYVPNDGTSHSTQKPVKLMKYLIKTYTNPEDMVLDFAMGSGTTGVACKELNRRFIGIEIDRHWFDVACKRIGET